MMPAHYSAEIRGETAWIAGQLDQLIIKQQYAACEHYSRVYTETMAKYAGCNDQLCQATRAANTRLRIYVLAVLNKGKIVQLKAI